MRAYCRVVEFELQYACAEPYYSAGRIQLGWKAEGRSCLTTSKIVPLAQDLSTHSLCESASIIVTLSSSCVSWPLITARENLSSGSTSSSSRILTVKHPLVPGFEAAAKVTELWSTR